MFTILKLFFIVYIAIGRKLAKFGHYVEVVPDGKDLGESSDAYVQYLLNKYATS